MLGPCDTVDYSVVCDDQGLANQLHFLSENQTLNTALICREILQCIRGMQ